MGDLDSVGVCLGLGNSSASEKNSDFVDTVLAKAIDTYVKRQKVDESSFFFNADGANHRMMMEDDDAAIDPRLESIADKTFAKCHEEKQWAHAVGVALESKRLDALENAISKADQPEVVLSYATG